MLTVWRVALGAPFEKGAATHITTMIAGPPLLLLIIAWIFSPRR
jgi:hypothetical protein